MWYALNQNELYHHGIKGQKWYVRRFQNEDGTLTEAGKRRYRKDNFDDSNYDSSHGNSDRRKKAVKIGVAAGAVALAAVGGYALYKSGKMGDLVIGGKKAFSTVKTKWDSYSGPVATLRKQAESLSDADLAKINTRMKLEDAYLRNNLNRLNEPKESRFDNVLAGLSAVGAAMTGVKAVRDTFAKKGNEENKKVSNVGEMSDQELRDLVNRANLENQYRNLYEKPSQSKAEKTKAERAIDTGMTAVSAGKSVENAIEEARRRSRLRGQKS